MISRLWCKLDEDKQEGLTLQEIYSAMPEVKQASIRATLNLDVKKGITFERISKGKYKLK